MTVTKEEGQSLIHAAHTWGEKAQSGSNAEGRETTKTELSSLQLDWDKYITTITDTKSSLELSLLQVRFLYKRNQPNLLMKLLVEVKYNKNILYFQWSDYSDSLDQITKWLRDTERKVKDTEPKPDLSEKKGQLQKVKVLYCIVSTLQ